VDRRNSDLFGGRAVFGPVVTRHGFQKSLSGRKELIQMNVLGAYSPVTYPSISKKVAHARPLHTIRLNLVHNAPVPQKVRVSRILGIEVQGPSLFERLRGKS
jgi:hypothetical protein